MRVRIGVDTGGTFTDVVLYEESTGSVYTTKTPSTPSDFAVGVLTGVEAILGQAGAPADDVTFLSHGTTVGTNAILEGDFPKLGLITNEGLRDVLEIGDQTRPELYNLQVEKPPALIPRYLRHGVAGRIDSRGNIVDELDRESAKRTIKDLVSEDVEGIVVALLFSHLNDDHERAVGDIIEDIAPDLEYALSSEVHPEIREYERMITTVLNQAIKNTLHDYLNRIDRGTAELGVEVPLNVMHSGGGVFGTAQATEHAIRTILSGPAGGAVAAERTSTAEGFDNAIGMDMGGTSADVSLVRRGKLVRSNEGEINDLPIKTPMIDINTVGAGGGSIVWIDEGGAIQVGPQSAGADPGPICYGQGGEDPTVTDANLLLGRIDPHNFLEGDMDLAVDLTRRVFDEVIASPMELSVEEAALSTLRVANARLARQIRKLTVERGIDPSEFVLVAFGGAGPLQAPAVAADMDIDTVLVPRSPGVFSARGLLIADIRMDESHSYRRETIDPIELGHQYEELETRLLDRFDTQGFDDPDLHRRIDLRYKGQSYELTVPIAGSQVTEASVGESERAFHEKHRRIYGHAMPDEPVEAVTLRVYGEVPTSGIDETISSVDADAYRDTRTVYFKDVGHLESDVYARSAIAPGETIDGPAILEEAGSTILVPPDTRATTSERGNLLIHWS